MPTHAGPPPAAASVRRYFPALDGVRGLSILIVFFGHWSVICSHGGLARFPGFERLLLEIADGGSCGVDLFFALSGFLITGILLDTRERPKFFSTFYARRTLRIFPPYYLALALFFFVLRPVLMPTWHYRQLLAEQPWFWSYLDNWLYALHGWPHSMVDHFWSLAVEEQFYLLWPLLVYFAGTRRMLWLCAAVWVVCPVLRTFFFFGVHLRDPSVFLYASTITRLDSLAAGGLVAAALRTPGLRAALRKYSPVAMLAGGGGFAVLAALTHGFDKSLAAVAILSYTLFALLFSGLLAAMVTRGDAHLLNRSFSNRPLRELGKISYVAYIAHLPMLDLAGRVASDRLLETWLLGAAATLAVSLASWRWFEQPLLKLKERLAPTPTAHRQI